MDCDLGPGVGWWFSRCENQRRVLRRNAWFGRVLPDEPLATAQAEFLQRENCHLVEGRSWMLDVSGGFYPN
jgi:hypothetical protein